MEMDWENRLASFEDLVRKGQAATVRRELRGVVISRIERRFRLKLANIARRVGLFSVSLRLLNPLVRPSAPGDPLATDSERAEYAVSLLNIGAINEAESLLSQILLSGPPETLLYRSFAAFAQWRYAESIPWLESYLSAKQDDPYARLVGETNLAAALVFVGHHQRARSLIDGLIAQTRSRGHLLLLGNALELSAQAAFAGGDTNLASRELERAADLLSGELGWNDVFVRKWQAILALQRAPFAEETEKHLDDVRATARRLRHWETLRECDFYQSIAHANEDLFNRVYVGTPWPAYRTKMQVLGGDRFRKPTQYVCRARAELPLRLVDVVRGEVVGAGSSVAKLKQGQILHRALVCLARDLYAPQRVGAMFSGLFPGEYFNPLSSPDRVHHSVARLRQWLTESKLGVRIEESHGTYSLRVDDRTGLRLSAESEATDRQGALRAQLLNSFKGRTFSTKDAGETLQLSRSAAQRILSELERDQLVERIGRGPRTRFKARAS